MLKLKDVDINTVSPMMKEYISMKSDYRDCFLFYRLGDFYEMFFDDAIKASHELELTLTGRSCGLEERAPMCGVPFHSASTYIDRLVRKGYKVAICEQLEDPAEATGIVKRGVVRIETPGFSLGENTLDADSNNYIVSIVELDGKFGLASCDISTGDFIIETIESVNDCIERIQLISPSEILYYLDNNTELDLETINYQHALTPIKEVSFITSNLKDTISEFSGFVDLDLIDVSKYSLALISARELVKYLYDLNNGKLESLRNINVYRDDKIMILDYSTKRNLELTETMIDKNKNGSFLHVLDKTKTAMGARKLRNMVNEPLIDANEINQRLDFVQKLYNDSMLLEELRTYLTPVYDIKRLCSRIIYGTSNAKDLISFKTSLSNLPAIKNLIKLIDTELSTKFYNDLDTLEDLFHLIDDAIIEEPPVSIKEGGIIKDGYNSDVDNLRYIRNNSKSVLSDIETEEKEKTHITNLKVKYNKVFGYFIEVSKGQLDKVPNYYIRKQTLTNAERFIVPKLKELEDEILGAQDKLCGLEYNLFKETTSLISKETDRIFKTSDVIASIDALCSLAYVAIKNNYVRPSINKEGILEIREGRHPVAETIISDTDFIPNDTLLDNDVNMINIITGPNMAGKSTYMRQVALIQLMSQIGSFVPAQSANISIVDRIFTRVGASDDLWSGQSTFMVEMNEVANIVCNATNKSLIILDEIGRGTSTYDGLSIAWAVTEKIANNIKAKTLFATHYHELTVLEETIECINNYSVDVIEKEDDIIFLRRLVKHKSDKSYGIQVAKLAGVPNDVINRAKEILIRLLDENNKPNNNSIDQTHNIEIQTDMNNDLISKYQNIIEQIKSIDINNLTPIDAMSKLSEIQKDIDC